MFRVRLGIMIFILLQTACASKAIIRDRDYTPAVEAYQLTDAADALEKFPDGEKNGFITSVEKGWLAQWAQKWDPQPMQKQVDTFDQRRYVSVTREAGKFLFQESEEGYVPSEHEIIILHLLSAVHFSQSNKPEDAKVELRRAGYVLDRFWDDPSLRIWLGALWASQGDWAEAQVDFRRAAQMTGDHDLRALSEKSKRPPSLALHFYGNGPRVAWKDGNYEPEFLPDLQRPMNTLAAFPTIPWFKRHTLRNNELRELLVKSNFMAQYLGNKTMTYAEHGIVKTTAMGIRIVGLAIGAAIVAGAVYLAVQSGAGAQSGEAFQFIAAAGLGIGGGIWAAGSDMDRDLTRDIKANDRKNQEDLRIYRMVRFMPTWIALDTDPAGQKPNTVTVPLGRGVELVNHF